MNKSTPLSPWQLASFDEYLDRSHKVLQQTHPHANKTLIEEIGPKQFVPNQRNVKGVLLIHGLLDSSSSMNSLYDSFVKQNYLVRSVLLPGHGTTPEDLLHVNKTDWLDCVSLAIKSFEQEVEDLTIVALSAGAVISCCLVNEYDFIKRLILFAPAFALKHSSAKLVLLLQKFNEYVPPLAKQWLVYEGSPEKQKAKYQSIATNAVYQLLQVIEQLDSTLTKSPIQKPMLGILSADDETISTDFAIKKILNQPNPSNHIILYSNNDKEQARASNITILPSCIPAEKILNYSHVGMHIAPNHIRYGKKPGKNDKFLGALTPKNQSNYPNKLARLTFNPNYDLLFEEICKFIEY